MLEQQIRTQNDLPLLVSLPGVAPRAQPLLFQLWAQGHSQPREAAMGGWQSLLP